MTMAEWEQELSIMFVKDYVANKKLTRQQVYDIRDTYDKETMQPGVIGVTHEERKQWLTDNGYEVNRENMLNGDLTVKQEDDEK
jgi:hypothetical protein